MTNFFSSQFYYIRLSFILLNVISVSLISCIVIFTPNLTVSFFEKGVQPSSIILVVVLLFSIMIAMWPLTRKVEFNIFSFVILLFHTMLLITLIIQLYRWFNMTIEGPFQYRFITFMKTASIEAKLQHYNLILDESLKLIEGKGGTNAIIYLKQLPDVINPSLTQIMATPLAHIKDVVATNVTKGLHSYALTIKTIDMTGTLPAVFPTWKKIVILGTSIAIGVGLIYYLGQSSVVNYIIKGFNLSKASSEISASESSHLAEAMNTLAKLAKNTAEISRVLVATREMITELILDMEASKTTHAVTQAACKFIIHVAIKDPKNILNLLQLQQNKIVADYLGRLPPGINTTL